MCTLCYESMKEKHVTYPEVAGRLPKELMTEPSLNR